MNEVELMNWVDHVSELMCEHEWADDPEATVTWAMNPAEGTRRDADLAKAELRRRFPDTLHIEVIMEPISGHYIEPAGMVSTSVARFGY